MKNFNKNISIYNMLIVVDFECGIKHSSLETGQAVTGMSIFVCVCVFVRSTMRASNIYICTNAVTVTLEKHIIRK